ncbi:MAG: SRPBCC family protein [Hyphomicrobiaceae bacterium]
MPSVWIWITIVVLAMLGVWIVLARQRPDIFRVTRSIEIDAPREAIYPMIADLKIMNTWNEFAFRDAEGKGHYKGAAQGVGAMYAFDGRKSGAGIISVTEVTPPQSLVMRLQMTKPMACDNRIDFTLVPNDNGTIVTWAMEGRAPLYAKMIQTVFNMDRMVGRDFETGLKRLKGLAEPERAEPRD